MRPQNSPARPRSRDTLPKPRGNLNQLLALSAFIISLLGNGLFIGSDLNFYQKIFFNISAPAAMLLAEQIIKRIVYGAEEVRHLHSFYHNSHIVLLKNLFTFNPISLFVFFGSISYFIAFFSSQRSFDEVAACSPWSIFAHFVNFILLKHVLAVENGGIYDSLWIENGHGLDYGSGMAHSFVNGYLKIVIPKTGTQQKHLEELMGDFEDKHGVRFDVKKMIILIPKSLYCPVSLEDPNSPSVEASMSLEPIEKTVAGVRDRSYKNSVYKISDGAKLHYVVAEYATPLKTFRDVIQSGGVHSEYYKRHQNEIVLQFYRTLKKTLHESPACKGYCELIFYEDLDEMGRYRDVGPIILRRLKKLTG